MNELFVNIKVDREERPDVDAVYMDAVVALTGQGGWPMTVFLTPDGEPFFGGTYYPPEPRHGMPAFRQVLAAIAEAYRDRRDDVRAAGGHARRRDRAEPRARSRRASRSRRSCSTRRCASCARSSTRSGAASAARRSFRPRRRSSSCSAAARSTSRWARSTAWRAGGMYDLVGGGFHRYSVDEQWLVPHFEKMLYDNALLVPAYLHAWLVTRRGALPRDRRADDRVHASASSGSRAAASRRRRTRTPTASKASPSRGQPTRFRAPRSCSSRSSTAATSSAASLDGPGARARSSRRATQRPQPLRDDKAIAAWNGLALAALAEAGTAARSRATGSTPRASSPSSCSARSRDGGRLHRTWRDGVAKGTGYLEDYANVAHGLYELHVATGELRWLAGVAPPRAPCGRALRRRRARRLLPRAVRRRAARRAPEGSRRQPDAVRQLDARLRAAAPRPDLGRRRARAAGGRRSAARARRDPARARRPSAGRSARSTCTSRRRASWRSSATRRARWRAPRSRRTTRMPSSPFGPAEDVPLLAGKGLVDGRAGGLRLRALRLPGAGHGSGASCR